MHACDTGPDTQQGICESPVNWVGVTLDQLSFGSFEVELSTYQKSYPSDRWTNVGGQHARGMQFSTLQHYFVTLCPTFLCPCMETEGLSMSNSITITF